MIASGDSKSRPEIIQNGPDSRGRTQLCEKRSDAAEKWYDEDQSCIDPVDMKVPVAQGKRLLSDMGPLSVRLHTGSVFIGFCLILLFNLVVG